MRCHIIAISLIALILYSPGLLYADVFHGRDKETGTMISRTSVDTITPEKELSVGLKIIRVHETNKVTLAFISLDERLKDLDTSSASLLIDAQSIPLTFGRYRAFTILTIFPPQHELWFAALDSILIAKIRQCKTMSLLIPTVSGIQIKRALRPAALSDVKEVLFGPRAEVTERVNPDKSATQKYRSKGSEQERKTVSVKPKKGILMATLNTTYFIAKDDPKCRNIKPDYSKFHTIVHLAANASIGTTEKNGKKIKVYVVITEGKDSTSGEARRLGFSADITSLFLGIGAGNNNAKMSMSMGEPGTRITFDGDENNPFEPIPGLRVWDGAVDIDPHCGLMIHAKGSK
jgi:hypothetical protein